MFFLTYTAGIIATITAVFAVLIFTRARKDPLARVLSYEMLVASLWIGINAFADVAYSDRQLFILCGFALIVGTLMISLFPTFVDIFCDSKVRRWRLVVYFLPSFFFGLVAFTHYSVEETFILGDQPSQIVPGISYTLYPFFSFSALAYGLIRLFSVFHKSTGKRQLQAVYLSVGFFTFLTAAVIFDVILPLHGEYRFYNLGPQFVAVLFLCSAYAILKHKLIDIRIVLQRGLIYSVLLGLTAAVYLGILVLVNYLFYWRTEISALFSGGVTAILGGFGIPVIERRFRKITDPIFFKNAYDYSAAMHELSGILNTALHTKAIVENTCAALEKILHATHVEYLLVKDTAETGNSRGADLLTLRESYERGEVPSAGRPQAILCANIPHQLLSERNPFVREHLSTLLVIARRTDAALLLPIMMHDRFLGMLLLSPKHSGESYSGEDITLLETFTDQAALALEHAVLYEQLENKVAVRTQEIATLQEEQTRMMLDLSHGLQTPLTILRAEIERLRKDARTSERPLLVLEHSIDHISKFVYDVLNLARLDVSDDFRKEPLDLSELVTEIAEYAAIPAKEARVNVTTDITPNVVILGKKDKIEEMITNLVGNSIKYMGSGKVRRIKIRLSNLGEGPVLSISDTGKGMTKDEMGRLFHRFYRAHEEEGTPKGTGLGLAIAERIAQKHGAKISVASASGKGSTFTILFPANKG